MKITKVTLTGADDTVDQADLISLSKKYPFVEWGILFSQSKSGVERYPSLEWVEKLKQLVSKENLSCNFAAHLCGKWVDDALNGKVTFLRDEGMNHLFNRLQFNMGKDRLKKAVSNLSFETALQSIKKNSIIGGDYSVVTDKSIFFRNNLISPLFDASGGRGIGTKEWPTPFSENDISIFCGYAGGLGPDNLLDEIKIIEAVVGNSSIWIDMETSLRSDKGRKFDLAKCEKVLDLMLPLFGTFS